MTLKIFEPYTFFCLLFLININFLQGEDMELKIWARTILTVQRHIAKVVRALDEVIYKRALSSIFVTSKNLMEQSSEAISNFIINVSQSKINLINLNTICISGLKAIDKICAKILILKHIDGRTSSEIANLLSISERTYFRRLNKAYDLFADYLEENGFDERYFKEKFFDEGWIMEVYYSCKNFFNEKNNGEILGEIDFGFLKGVIKSITKTAHSSYS